MRDHGKERLIEPCIYYTASGKFYVRARANARYHTATLPTLGQARRFREEVRAMRPPRERLRWETDGVSKLLSSEHTSIRQSARAMLKSSPREKIKVNGRTYTKVLLPEAGRDLMMARAGIQ